MDDELRQLFPVGGLQFPNPSIETPRDEQKNAALPMQTSGASLQRGSDNISTSALEPAAPSNISALLPKGDEQMLVALLRTL